MDSRTSTPRPLCTDPTTQDSASAGEPSSSPISETVAAPGPLPPYRPERIGSYRILETLGQGGMGTVYLAEQVEPLKRRVALKVIRRGTANEEAITRVEIERQAMAVMSHPNVAQIYDAGTTDEGEPYFVLEYIPGLPITRYCDLHRLDVCQRLELFITVCEAVHHAHQKAVLHRDIKPSNVLVTEVSDRPVPKIIDFGVAKSLGQPLTDNTLHSGIRILGTPAYLSPEALEGAETGLQLDVRSDIYSLGVLLYELLVGVRPFDDGNEAPFRVIRRILTEPFTAPSERLGTLERHDLDKVCGKRQTAPRKLERRLRRGLDSVTAKAMSRDRSARYDSAADLAREVRQQLGEGKPAKLRPKVLVPVLLAGLIVLSWAWITQRARLPATPMIRSLAVLPLEDLSPPPREEYFADSMTEALIVRMAHIRSLRVISRTSVMALKGTRMPLPEIAQQLSVDAVLEGTILRQGDMVRLTAQLILAETDEHLWSRSYERDLTDVLSLQRELARTIAAEIRMTLTPEEQDRLARANPVDPAAYESYLKGRYFWNKRTLDDLRQAIRHFEQAARLAPADARGYAGLAACFALLPSYGGMAPEENYPQAKAAALQALAIDASMGSAYASLALVQHEYEWDHRAAEESYRRAIALEANDATAHQWFAEFLTRQGRYEEALEQIRKARMLDPLSLIVNAVEGWVLLQAERPAEATEHLRAALELEADFAPAHGYLAAAHLAGGRFDEAIAQYRTALRLSGDHPRYISELGVAQALGGDESEARQALMLLARAELTRHVPAFHFARLYTALGDTEAALEALEKAAEQRGVWILSIGVDPMFAGLRQQPRFQALVRRLGLFPAR